MDLPFLSYYLKFMNQALWKPCGDVTFDEFFRIDTLPEEGGLCEDPNDSGGITKYGVICADGFSRQQIIDLTVDQAKQVYFQKYWQSTRCAELWKELAREVLDQHINTGRGITTLQSLIFTANVDGIFGPMTMNDLKYYVTKHDCSTLVQRYAQFREHMYETFAEVQSQNGFLAGWLNRNEKIAAESGVTVER